MRVTDSEYESLRVRTGKARNVISQPVQSRPSKYRNKKVTVDGLTFDSQGEARRWWYHCRRQTQGEISQLRHHFPIPIIINEIEVCFYEADFDYMEGGTWVVEDFKGKKTDIYTLKKKLLAIVYGIAVKEVRKA